MVKFALNAAGKLPEQMWINAKTGTFTDVKIAVDKRVLFAHRAVLSCFSDYLNNFFKGNKKKTVFPVKNMSFKAVKDILKMLYRGTVNVEPCQVNGVKLLISILKIDAVMVEEDDDEYFPEQLRHEQEASFAEVLNSTEVLDIEIPATDGDNEGEAAAVTERRHRKFTAKGKLRKMNRKGYWMRTNRRSSGILSLACRFCPYQRFSNVRSRSYHETTCCFNPNSRDFFVCDLCGKSYLFKGVLARHMEKKHIQQ